MPYRKIIVDCERMKYPFTGLYSFCLQLSQALLRHPELSPLELSFYVPPSSEGFLGSEADYKLQHSLHKMHNPKNNTKSVWHGTYQGSNYFPKNTSQPKMLTIHDLNFLYDERKSAEKKNKYLQQVQEKINRSQQLTVISEFTLDCVQNNLDTGNIPIEVIYNGCDVDLKINPPEQPGFISADENYIFSVGTIAQKKNFHVLPCLLAKNNFKLVIAGVNQDQAYYDRIIAEAKKWNVADRLILAGSVTEAEKWWLMKNAKAFAFPSLAEGFGLPVIEAMHFGIPVLLSTETSLPEIGADAAWYFPNFEPEQMQDTLAKCLQDFAENPERKNRSLQRAGDFSWEKAATAYIKLYKKLATQ